MVSIIQLDSIDSTNNYAMQLIDANKAQHGLTVTAQSQTGGKGQRGKTWADTPGESLLMSIIITPKRAISEQFASNATVATAIANYLQNSYRNWDIRIKWPNDIIVNDKKAGGILIENVLRGSVWAYSVIGLGLNVNQVSFPAGLHYATSLKIVSKNNFEIISLRDGIRENILTAIAGRLTMNTYNELLYRRGQKQSFSNGAGKWEATILKANTDGTLEVLLDDGTTVFYQHGQVAWEW